MNEVARFGKLEIHAEAVETFTYLSLAPDGSDAVLFIEQMVADGVAPDDIMLDLLAPSARLMGELWCADVASFVDVTLGLSRLQTMMRQFRLPEEGCVAEKGSLLLAAVPGEQHTFGLRQVEELFLRSGWHVRSTFGASEADIVQLVACEPYDFVGFSISGERLLPALRSAIRNVRAASRNQCVRIMLGGALFAGNPAAGDGLDADAVVADAREAVAQADDWFALAGVS